MAALRARPGVGRHECGSWRQQFSRRRGVPLPLRHGGRRGDVRVLSRRAALLRAAGVGEQRAVGGVSERPAVYGERCAVRVLRRAGGVAHGAECWAAAGRDELDGVRRWLRAGLRLPVPVWRRRRSVGSGGRVGGERLSACVSHARAAVRARRVRGVGGSVAELRVVQFERRALHVPQRERGQPERRVRALVGRHSGHGTRLRLPGHVARRCGVPLPPRQRRGELCRRLAAALRVAV